jgi:hypothetical protein
MFGRLTGLAQCLQSPFFTVGGNFLVTGYPPTIPAGIRGSAITQDPNPTTLKLNYPAGSAPGDLALIFAAGWNPTARAGWTDLGIDSRFTWTDFAASRILTAGDLTPAPGSPQGSVSADFHGGLDGLFALIVFVGPTGGIRAPVQSLWTAGGVLTITNTFGITAPGDTAVYFASVRGSPTAPVITPSEGSATTLQSTVNSGSILATQVLPGDGPLSVGSTFPSGAGAGCQAAQICIIGTPGEGEDFITANGDQIDTPLTS